VATRAPAARRLPKASPLAVSVPEAARLLGISRNLAYDLVRMRELPAVRVGERRLLIPVAALKEWLESASSA
jgi:excisionase family DNA binding protein